MTISIEKIFKAYDGRYVLNDFSMELEDEQTIILYGPSGSGKTTLIRILLGLEKPDDGKVVLMGDYKYDYLNAGVVFQDDRLCGGFDAVTNVTMTDHKTTGALAEKELKKLLPEDRLHIPVSKLSVADKKCVAIVRAMVHPADFFILDDPFRGMTGEARTEAVNYIMESRGSSPVLITALEENEFKFGRKVAVNRNA